MNILHITSVRITGNKLILDCAYINASVEHDIKTFVEKSSTNIKENGTPYTFKNLFEDLASVMASSSNYYIWAVIDVLKVSRISIKSINCNSYAMINGKVAIDIETDEDGLRDLIIERCCGINKEE